MSTSSQNWLMDSVVDVFLHRLYYIILCKEKCVGKEIRLSFSPIILLFTIRFCLSSVQCQNHFPISFLSFASL